VGDDEGVEFLHPGPGPGAGGPEEVEDAGSRRPNPRWVVGLTGLGIAVAVVLALTLTGGGAPGTAPHSVTPARSGLPSSFAIPPPDRLPANPVFDDSLTVPHGPIEAATLGADGSRYLLSPGHLMRLGPHSRHAGDIATGVGAASGETDRRLVPVGDRLWAIGVAAKGTRLIALEAGSGRVLHRGSLATAVGDSATLDGHLYLATSAGGYDVAPGAPQPRRIRGLPDAASITAEAARHRLLLLAAGQTSTVRAYRPGGPTDGAGVPVVPMVKGWVRVAGSTIWLGFGSIAQHWPAVYGAVVSRAGVAYSAENGSTVHRLHLNAACRG
jgi:hypothetical protein